MVTRVMCEGNCVGAFDDPEDAVGLASAWNHAYPSPEYAEFTVEFDNELDKEFWKDN